ncbi:MAG: hypothetical protein HZA08_13510 [Nitrospirae bacterium]|nr:hypothetical protein [Nitrospirota bacterium]
MKPILHIINNPDDAQAIDTVRIQGKDNAYGVAAVFTGGVPSVLPPMPDVRVCVLREEESLNETQMSETLTKGHENQRDKNVPPILNIGMDRRGFLTPPERLSGEPINMGVETIGYEDLINLIFSVETISVW